MKRLLCAVVMMIAILGAVQPVSALQADCQSTGAGGLRCAVCYYRVNINGASCTAWEGWCNDGWYGNGWYC